MTLVAEVEKTEGEMKIWDNRYSTKFSITQKNNLIKILHETNVHQYVCTEAANIFGKGNFSNDSGKNYLGSSSGLDPNTDSTICGGSYQIDHYNSVWPKVIITPTVTHAWNADLANDDDTWGFIPFVPNAWLHAKRLWNGWSTGGGGKGIVEYYNIEGNKGEAYKNLGQIAHLIQDMGVPAHAHCDMHLLNIEFLGIIILELDDCYEDWMKDNARQWTSQHALDAGGLINIPWDKRPSEISEDIFPLYYLMYTTNQYADHFASDDDDGDNNDKRNWVDYSGWSGPTTAGELEQWGRSPLSPPLSPPVKNSLCIKI